MRNRGVGGGVTALLLSVLHAAELPIYHFPYVPMHTKGKGVIPPHTRIIYTEGKAKVVAAILGTEFNQFLAELAVLNQDGMKNRMNSSLVLVQLILFFKSA